MSASEWTDEFGPFGPDDKPLPYDEIPATLAVRDNRPYHGQFRIRAAGSGHRDIAARYGGNTSCVEVTLSDGSTLILDAGTGIRNLGPALSRGSSRRFTFCSRTCTSITSRD